MRDGHTQRLPASSAERPSTERFFLAHRAVLVVVAGKELGTEFELTKSRVVMGRGPAVDIAVDDPTMSRQHVAFDLLGEKFRVQDLGSTNGILLNGTTVAAADLAHGDRLKIGQTVFQFLLESVEQKPRTYVVSE